MEQRVKERLTGAALLVAVVVLLVPELFRGERGSGNTTHPADPTAPPVQSYTIELGTAPPAAPEVATLPVALPQAIVPAAPIASVPASAAKPHVAAPKAVSRGWAVQVGSFAKRENAARMVQQAAKKGVKLAIAGPDDRGLYRVRSPVQVTRAVATQLQAELQAKGFKGMVANVP